MRPDPTSSEPRAHVNGQARHPLTEEHYSRARAYRDGELVCGRVELTVTADLTLSFTARERHHLAARFSERVHPALRTELAELVRRRGAAARRAAEQMEPVELVFDHRRRGRQRIVCWVQPPQARRGWLYDVEFGLRRTTS